jgi:hypothetical protein
MLAQKTRKSRLRSESKLRDDNHLPQFQSHRGGFTAKVSEIIFVAFTDLLDDAVHPQTFEQARHLAGRFVGKVMSQLLVGETADEELALQQGAKQTGVLFREEIEALVTMLVFNFGFSQFAQFLHTDFWSGDSGDELQIALVGGEEQCPQSG